MTEHLLDQNILKAYIGSILVAICKEAKLTMPDMQMVLGLNRSPNALGKNFPANPSLFASDYIHKELTRLSPRVMKHFGQDLRDFGEGRLGKNELSLRLLTAIVTPTGPNLNGRALTEMRVNAVFADCKERKPKRVIPKTDHQNIKRVEVPDAEPFQDYAPTDLWSVLAYELLQHIPMHAQTWEKTPASEQNRLIQNKITALRKEPHAQILNLWNACAAGVAYKCAMRKGLTVSEREALDATTSPADQLAGYLADRGLTAEAPKPPEDAILRRAYHLLRYRPK